MADHVWRFCADVDAGSARAPVSVRLSADGREGPLGIDPFGHECVSQRDRVRDQPSRGYEVRHTCLHVDDWLCIKTRNGSASNVLDDRDETASENPEDRSFMFGQGILPPACGTM